MTSPKWISAYVVSWYFRITGEDRRKLRDSLKGIPHIKQSNSRCSNSSGWYYLYDLGYLIDGLGLKPIGKIPEHLIKS